jgi:hypothetical protein
VANPSHDAGQDSELRLKYRFPTAVKGFRLFPTVKGFRQGLVGWV